MIPAELRGDATSRAEPLPESDVAQLLPLIAHRTLLVHPKRSAQTEGGGGDVDLLVEELDPNWPLRLPPGWRLCQVLHYDVKGWYWVLDHDGATLALDTVDDPKGLGRDGISTPRLIDLAERHPNAARAAYLTAKRVRKGMAERADWERIRDWAATAPDAYERALSWTFGDEIASQLASSHEWVVPPDEVMQGARRVQWRRRRGDPTRALSSLWASAGRWYRRVTQPTGLFVLVAGPDGTGKSTLAKALPEICEGPFRRWQRLHSRPGILPRAGALLGMAGGDPTRPHSRPVHGPLVSLASLGYQWLDSFLGGWLRIAPFRIKSGLVVVERGWWDIAVDPRRYRLAVPSALVHALGRFLTQPDLLIVLEAPPSVLIGRKAEIESDELARQTRAWRSMTLPRARRAFIDVARPEEEVGSAAREAVFSLLAERASGRVGAGWAALPPSPSPRWLLPRGPSATALSGLSVYQPVTYRGRLGWEAARALAAVGLFRALPRGVGPPERVREVVGPHVPKGATLSVARTNHPNRFVVLIVGREGNLHAIAKVALDGAGEAALEAETHGLETFAVLLPSPLRAPRILDRAPGLLLLEAVEWSPRSRPWVLPSEVARALGQAFAASADGCDRGWAHGDFAPWNLLKTPGDWVLIDWEESGVDAPPFFDVFHYFVQGAVLLHRPPLSALTKTGHLPPWTHAALRAYSDGAALPLSTWRRHLVDYLRLSMQNLDRSDPEQARGLAARQQLLRSVGG
jgi:hypothetical protein